MTLTLLTGRTPVHTDHGTEKSLLPKPGSDGDLRLLGKVNEFFQAITEPAPLIAGAVAGPIFSVVRNPTLSWLLSKPAALATRGLGARLFSAAVALPGEIAAFGLTQRAVQYAIHPHSLDWSREALWHEAGGLALTFGLFKMHGRLAQTLLPKSLQNFQSLAGAVGMYSGILHSHLWEEHLGWREHSTWADKFTQSFETYLQLKAMGHITHHVMGPRYNAWVASLEAKADALQKPWTSGNSWTPAIQAVTPEGTRIPLAADDLIQKMSSSEHEGPRRTTPPEMEIELASDPKGIALERVASDLELAWNAFSKKGDPGRTKAVQKIMANESVALETLYQKYVESGLSEKDAKKAVVVVSDEVRREHFRLINLGNFKLLDRLSYLVSELRKASRRAKGDEQTTLDKLFESAEGKQWEANRVYSTGESILANSMGETDTEFSADKYPSFCRKYQEFNQQMQEYLNRNPQFEKILENYRDPTLLDESSKVTLEDLDAMIARSDFPKKTKGFLQDALQFDPFLSSEEDFRPLYQVFKRLEGGVSPKKFLELTNPLSEYLESLKHIRAWVSRKDFRKIEGSAFFGAFPGEAAVLRKNLAEKIKERWEQSDRSANMGEIMKALDVYIEKIPSLLELMTAHRPSEPFLPSLKWDEVKGRLKDKVKKGMVHPNASAQLLEWIEGGAGITPDSTLSHYRSEFIAGMLEFFFNEARSFEEQEIFNLFLAEVCERKDLLMMRNLAVRFHNYHRGMETRSRYSAKGNGNGNGNGNGMESHEILKDALLKTAEIYQNYPRLRGPYFEILEKVADTQQQYSRRLNAPIHLRIQNLLQDGLSVELLAHPSLGVELLRIGNPSEPITLELVSSIQENLDKRESFNRWMNKLAYEVEKFYDDESYRITLFIPRIRKAEVDVLTWARDFLEVHSKVSDIILMLPNPGQTKPTEPTDPLDKGQYGSFRVDRQLPTTEAKIEILQNEIARKDFSIGNYLTLYEMLKEKEFPISLESEAFSVLLEARRHSPDNKTVAGEMWRLLEQNFRMMRFLGHDQLSDFTSEDLTRNLDHLRVLELMARDPVQYTVIQAEGKMVKDRVAELGTTPEQIIDLVGRKRERVEELMKTVRGSQPHPGQEESDFSSKLALIKAEPFTSLIKVIEGRNLTLGSIDHFDRVGLFVEAILGQPFPNLELKEVFDLSPLGYETKNWHLRYNPKRPNQFSLRGEITLTEDGRIPFSRPRNSLTEKDSDSPITENGFVEIRIQGISNKGETRLVVQRMRPPIGHSGNGVGTLLTERLITLGQKLGARYLVFRNVENSGKYALVKMGGRVDRDAFRTAQRVFPPFVDQKAQEYKLWGYDVSAATSIKTAQEMADAYFDPLSKSLRLERRWGKPEKTSDVFFVSPEDTSKFLVGRQFFLERPVQDWEITFDLREGSPGMKQFWKYYAYRFDLPDGEILIQPPKNPGDSEDSGQD